MAADTGCASESIPVFLTITDEIEMGKTANRPIKTGECVYIPTGGMLPEGANAMVMVEYCERFGETGISVFEAISPGRNVVFAGENAQTGDIILTKGTYIRPLEIGVLAATGIVNPLIYAPLTMTIISTGDELTDPSILPEPGQVRDINTYTISALAKKAGYKVIKTFVLKDNEILLKDTVNSAMQKSDIVVISGGSSQGQKDSTAKIIDEIASEGVLTHGMAIKPGKPTISGYDDKSKTLLIGLPGHPVSAMMVFQMLLSWLWLTLTGSKQEIKINAKTDRNIPGSPGKDTLQMVTIKKEQENYLASPIFAKSGDIIHLSSADGYLIIDKNKEGLQTGESVLVNLF